MFTEPGTGTPPERVLNLALFLFHLIKLFFSLIKQEPSRSLAYNPSATRGGCEREGQVKKEEFAGNEESAGSNAFPEPHRPASQQTDHRFFYMSLYGIYPTEKRVYIHIKWKWEEISRFQNLLWTNSTRNYFNAIQQQLLENTS